MNACDYEAHRGWGHVGWLGSPAYYSFWGRVFSHYLGNYLSKKSIIDVGPGNGRIWLSALDQGLVVKKLHLVEPAQKIDPELVQRPEVVTHTISVQDWQPVRADVVVFKQSIHHVQAALGTDIFCYLRADYYIDMSMQASTEWPMSPELTERFNSSVLDVRATVAQAGKNIKETFVYSFPVVISRDVWCEMIRQRFTSILHACGEAFIEQEISWIKQNLPATLNFNDSLECSIIY